MLERERMQAAIRDAGLGGWLLYDFHDQNPIARDLVLPKGRHFTRRWFCLVPPNGPVRWLLHRIEQAAFSGVEGERILYAGRRDLVTGLAALLDKRRRVAMEYSPGGQIPTASRVDAGTLELVRAAGVEVVSSADLVQTIVAPWPAGGRAAHERAARALEGAVDRAWALVADRLGAEAPATECEVQAALSRWIEEAGLLTDHPPIVAVDGHAADPHFAPRPEEDEPIGPGRTLLIDLWAREPGPAGVYADLTLMAHTAAMVPARVAEVWTAVRDARDRAVDLVQARAAAGEAVAGYELDRAARAVIGAAGFGERFVHRTGHSLGPEVHWVGANLDDYETQDTRPLIPGTGFTIEPGIYLPGELGIRSELDMVWGDGGPVVTTRRQQELERLG